MSRFAILAIAAFCFACSSPQRVGGFSGDFGLYFEHLTEDANWAQVYSNQMPTGTKLYRFDADISGKRVSNGDAALWSQIFGVRRDGSDDLELVGTTSLNLDLAIVNRDLGAALWDARVRVDGGDLYIEVKGGSYDVEWRADILGYGFQTLPE
jgi:hypothetical protein